MADKEHINNASQGQGTQKKCQVAQQNTAPCAHQDSASNSSYVYDESTRLYYEHFYRSFYGGYYTNSVNSSFDSSYNTNAQIQNPLVPKAEYQNYHDYSSWYQQRAHNYSYDGVTCPSSYPYSNNYGAYATHAEQQNTTEAAGPCIKPPKQADFSPKEQVSFPPPPLPPVFLPPHFGHGLSVPYSQVPKHFPKIVYGMKDTTKDSEKIRASSDNAEFNQKTTCNTFKKSGQCEASFTVSGESNKTPQNPTLIAIPTTNSVTPVMLTPSNSNTNGELVEKLLHDTLKGVQKVSNSLRFKNGFPVCPSGLREFFTRMYSKHPIIKTGRKYEQAVIDLVVNAAANGRLHRSNWLVHPAPSILKQSRATAAPENGSASPMSLNFRISTVPEASNSEINTRRVSKSSSEYYPKRKDSDESARLLERLKRFKAVSNPSPQNGKRVVQAPTEQNRADVIDWDDATIIGTCLKHEKSYFRLTSKVNPALVRPLHILEEWSEKLMEKYAKDKDYRYFLDQFQSIRQDLTVQRIKNHIAIRTYETVARVALEMGDLGEFNKCQTILQ